MPEEQCQKKQLCTVLSHEPRRSTSSSATTSTEIRTHEAPSGVRSTPQETNRPASLAVPNQQHSDTSDFIPTTGDDQYVETN